MLRRVMSDVDVVKGLKSVLERIEAATAKRAEDLPKVLPRLVAVSKTKSVQMIAAAYDAGQLHFGENYVQELVDKAHNPQLLVRCPDIRWHLIGHLQRNKVGKVVTVPGLYMVESVDSQKLASSLDAAWQRLEGRSNRLKVMVQVNTSGETEKSGCKLEEVTELTKHVLENCKNLDLVGLMAIGKYGYDSTQGLNPDYLALLQARKHVCNSLSLESNQLELSMGMSNDFEQAVEMGSTNVRVGTAIFGSRETIVPTREDEQLTQDFHKLGV